MNVAAPGRSAATAACIRHALHTASDTLCRSYRGHAQRQTHLEKVREPARPRADLDDRDCSHTTQDTRQRDEMP